MLCILYYRESSLLVVAAQQSITGKQMKRYCQTALKLAQIRERNKQQGHSTERNTRTDEENRVVIKFDTEKPVTKETGLPPIKEISFTGSTTNQKKEVYTEIDTEKNIKSVISDSTAVNRKTDKKEDIKTSKEIKPSTNLWKALLYICLIVFSYYLFDVLRAHWPKIKQLWRRVFKL